MPEERRGRFHNGDGRKGGANEGVCVTVSQTASHVETRVHVRTRGRRDDLDVYHRHHTCAYVRGTAEQGVHVGAQGMIDKNWKK
jgi:hypothetical protein